MRFVFAGDRDISVHVLQFILEQGHRPMALVLPENASHDSELRHLVPDAPAIAARFFEDEITRLGEMDYLLCIHFPHLISQSVLEIPRVGAVNLHPAYLPFNRGWHTPSWSILEETPAGATLHFIDKGVDTGDIIHQKQLRVHPDDTAHSLYQRLKALELEVFREAWPDLVALEPKRRPQEDTGTTHRKADLLEPLIQRIDLEDEVRIGALLTKLRALTTNRIDEAAYFEKDGARYRVRVEIVREEDSQQP